MFDEREGSLGIVINVPVFDSLAQDIDIKKRKEEKASPGESGCLGDLPGEDQPQEETRQKPGQYSRCQSDRNEGINRLLHESLETGKSMSAVNPDEFEEDQARDHSPTDQGAANGFCHR